MTSIVLTDIAKYFGDTCVLHDINLHIESGEFVVFVGPSGCGKSTLLRIIAGLETITSGSIEMDHVVVNDLPSSQRGVAMVFQTYALYPHMSVYDNLAFGLRIAQLDPAEIDTRIRTAADILKLTDYLKRLPKALSGGQRQRVAIGRAIVRQPRIFLFDEPLSNLDAALRVAMRIEITDLNDRMPDSTMIYVTHDQVEAMTLADRIVVLSETGSIEQVGEPLELYREPANLFVARFIGSPAMNIIDASFSGTGNEMQLSIANDRLVPITITTDYSMLGGDIKVGIRPEDLRICDQKEGLLTGSVAYVESLGEISLVHLKVKHVGELVVIKVPGELDFHKGQQLSVQAHADRIHVFDSNGRLVKSASTMSESTQEASQPRAVGSDTAS